MTSVATVESESSPHYEQWERLRSQVTWTPELRAFAKKSDLCVLFFNAVSDAPSWHRDAAFVTLKFVQEKRGDRPEKTMYVKAAGYIGTGYCDDVRTVSSEYPRQEYSREPQNLYRPTSGSWLLYLYPNQATHVYSCLMTIPSKANLVFRVRLDYASSPVLAEARLHGDMLTLDVTKGLACQGFDLDTQISRHNGARFGFHS